MAMKINTNVTALNAQRNLLIAQAGFAQSVERLSSGFRINRAADDPAGLVNSENLRAQVEGLGQAIANTSEAVNMLKTAEAALNEVNSLLRSMRNLALHAANTGPNDSVALTADQNQIASAIESLNRIAATTQYGTKYLLNGAAGNTALVNDITNVQGVTGGGALGTGAIGISVIQTAAVATSSIGQGLAVTGTVSAAGTLTINGVAVNINATDTYQDVINKVNGVTSTTGVVASFSNGIVFRQQTAGSAYSITVSQSAAIISGLSSGVLVNAQTGTNVSARVSFSTNGAITYTAIITGSGTVLQGTLGPANDLRIALTNTGAGVGAANGMATGTVIDDINLVAGGLRFQIGANFQQTVSISISNMAANNLGTTATGLIGNPSNVSVAIIDVTTSDGAQNAIKILDQAISDVSAMRARLGAIQKNTLETTINSLGVARENLAASESTIRDTDTAGEIMRFTRFQLQMQAATAMLAQANQAPQLLLSLLGGG
ncbi:MAG: flagellin [Abditibacteriales bacterium]|nr:flagellin [Abditibacteriales bacterium]MDW8365912.1 flagellin [Abditibacteriales bacterium]